MNRTNQTLSLGFLICDLIVTLISWVGAYYLYFYSGWFILKKAIPEQELCWNNLPIVLLTALFVFRKLGQNQINRLRRFREDLLAAIQGTALTCLLVTATIFFRQNPYETRGAMGVFAALQLILILIGHRLLWETVRYLRKRGFNQSNALIVGSGRTARKTAQALRRANWLGIRTIGFVEDLPNNWSQDLLILGSSNDLPQLIQQFEIEHVFIALPMNRYDEARKIFDILAQTVVEVRLVADVPALAGFSLTTTSFDGLPIIGLRENPHYGINRLVKRVMDMVISSIALLMLAPLFLLLGILIKLSSKGPIFYRQERCSLNGKPFYMLKFRSMRVDAEAEQGPTWATKEDQRRTTLGSFLRKTSLDELPQLINVLIGDMSLVGPRPERPHFIHQFRKSIPNYMARHCVKCGITGWAQVNGWRGNTSLRKRVQFDLYYITHWNPWFDLRILWLTIWKGFVHPNAY